MRSDWLWGYGLSSLYGEIAMVILGITDGISCGAAIVRDGRIVAAVNEESLCRLKMAYGFPRLSIGEVLRLTGLTHEDISLVAVATNNNYFFDGIRPWEGWLRRDKGAVRDAVFQTAGSLGRLAQLPGVEAAYYGSRQPIFALRRRAIRRVLSQEFGLSAPVQYVNHHLAHAASAYFTSGFTNSLVLTMDGGGDGASSHIYWAENGCFKRLGSTSAFNSLGNYYSYATEICGFTAQKHEGKITGLAAHGEPVYLDVLNSLIKLDNGHVKNIGGAIFAGGVKALEARLPSGWRREDLAASIQVHSEAIAVGYLKSFLNGRDNVDLAVAGGVFANVRINQELHRLSEVNRIFVYPAMTDAGLAAGAALVFCMQGRTRHRMKRHEEVLETVYLGPGFSSREIEKALRASQCEFERPQSVEREIAQHLARGHVVARFNGRLEYGPRALGNRSILYHPGDATVNDWLNKKLHRTEFMPFAPATLADDVDRYYLDWHGAQETARFMTITLNCTEEARRTCPSVVHIDNTARPQFVRESDNPSFYKIIREFHSLTGVGTVINTSFNMHEEPIVCTPQDAIRAFRKGNLDVLAIGDFIVRSKHPISHPISEMPGIETSDFDTVI